MEKAKIKIRECSVSDLERVKDIGKLSFPRQDYSLSYFRKYFQKHPETFILAENKEGVVGYAIGQIKNELGRFISLAVEPNFRQNGIGTALSNFLIELFQKNRVKEISLRVRMKNKVAISFYERLGFKPYKVVKEYYRDGKDAMLMRKKLTSL